MFIDVFVPGPWWNALTYVSDTVLCEGARVLVPIRGGVRVGFVAGVCKTEPKVKCKKIIDVIDNSCILGKELWTLSRVLGSSFLCGRGEMLKVISPKELLKPIAINEQTINAQTHTFTETHCYIPNDSTRHNLYIQKLEQSEHSLVLFPEIQTAKNFHESLPGELKKNSLLWKGENFENWLHVRAGDFRVVIGSAAAAYVPQNLSLVIVDEEASGGYLPKRHPKIGVRSVAGQRAMLAGCELVLGGRLPGAKTYLRKKIPCGSENDQKPDKNMVRFADIKDSFDALVDGVEKALPLTKTLVAETQKCLSEGRRALWIFDRKGYATEIFCNDCGQGLRCECKSLLSIDGAGLLCPSCGKKSALPEKCPACGGKIFIGKRPGIEALEGIAKAIKRENKKGKLLIGTRKILSACDENNIALVGWIDIDAETRKRDYRARAQAFAMVWESIWRGNDDNSRTVIVQSRRPSVGWQAGLKAGWEVFWDGELAERRELGFPPCELLVEIDVQKVKDREKIAQILNNAGYLVMEGEDGKVNVSVRSIARLEKTLASRFSVSQSRLGFPCVTIFVE